MKRKSHLVLIFLSCISTQSFLELVTTKQEFSGSTLSQISDTFHAYSKFDKINYNDLFTLTAGERVVYIYKFKDKLPDSFIELSIVNEKLGAENEKPRKYTIQKIKDRKVFDEKKLRIVEKDTATIITEYLNKTDTFVYEAYGNFINSEMGGCNHGDIWLSVKEDKFNIETGIEKLFYSILWLTK